MGTELGREEKVLADLLGLVYATIDEPGLWTEVLTRLGRAIAAEQTLLFVGNDAGKSNGSALLCRDTSPDELLAPFLEHYAGVNVLAAPCDRMFVEGTTRYSHWAVADAEFERSEFYQDFFARLGLFYSMGIKGRLESGAEVYLSSQRGRVWEGFSEAEGRLLPMVLPHLQRALMLRRRLEGQRSRLEAAETALEAKEGAVLGLDALGRMRYCSREAEALLREGRVLRVVRGRIAAVQPNHEGELQRCVRAALQFGRDMRNGAGMSAAVLRGTEGEVLLTVVAVPQTADGISGGVEEKQAGVAVLLYLQRGVQAGGSRGAAMRALYGVTPTEERVMAGLLAGQDVAEVAAALRMTNDATRFHVKRLLAKTGARRQAELVAIVLRLPATGGSA